MLRSEKRRQARELKKQLDQMSITEVQDFITEIYVAGVNNTMALNRDALKELYGFGDGRYSKVHEFISDRLTKNERKTLETMENIDRGN